jgi:hypothetical protein
MRNVPNRPRVTQGLALLALLNVGCGPLMPAENPLTEECSLQVILSFSGSDSAPPTEAVVENIAISAGGWLAYQRNAGPGLYVYSLEVEGPMTSCRAALTRLKADPRITTAEEDSRRHPSAKS